MIVFITCGAKKKQTPCAAKDLYIGTYFKTSLAYAQYLNVDKIYILSAQYGVLELNDEIAPYNKNLNAASRREQKIWAYKCYKQLQEKGVDFNEQAIFLGGKGYWQYLSQLFPNKKIPFAHLKIGMQVHTMRELMTNVHDNEKN